MERSRAVQRRDPVLSEVIEAVTHCITNTRHPELAHVGQMPCVYPASDEDKEAQPRKAVKGRLCFSCWKKLEDALGRVEGVVMHLRSTEGGGQGLTERVASSLTWRLPIPPSWMMADSIVHALGAPAIPSTADLDETREHIRTAVKAWTRDPETVVQTVDGAAAAVVLYRHVQSAIAGWPEVDADRLMPAPLRCPKCQSLALNYRAPLEYLDDLRVTCGVCGHVQAWEDFTEWTQEFTRAFEEEKRAEARRLRRARLIKQKEEAA